MTAAASKPQSLRKASWAVLKQNLKPLSLWGILLAALQFPLSVLSTKEMFHQFALLKAQVAIVQANGNPESVPQPDLSITTTLFSLASSSMSLLALYILTILILRKNPITANPHYGVKSFMHWLGCVLIPFMLVYMPSLIIIGLGIWLDGPLPSSIDLVLTLASWITLAIAVRFMPVIPLAATPIKNLLQVSWQLTRGNWWRLAWDYTILNFAILFLAFVILILPPVLISIYMTTSTDSLIDLYLIGTAFSVMMALVNIVTAVFLCESTRILYKEKQQSDPAFTLTTHV